MDNQQNQSTSLQSKPSSAPLLRESAATQKEIDALLFACATSQKLYGRDPAAFESIIKIIHNVMADFPAQKVALSIKTWLMRSPEFPTVSDLVNLVKRNGKPPIKESDVITIRKKDGEDRTPDDWATLREWDKQQQEGFGTYFVEEQKDTATVQENIRLRTEMRELKAEYARLAEVLRQERQQKGLPGPEIKLEDKLL